MNNIENVIAVDTGGFYFRRLWCVYELIQSKKFGKSITLLQIEEIKVDKNLLKNAKCTNKNDGEHIKKLINKKFKNNEDLFCFIEEISRIYGTLQERRAMRKHIIKIGKMSAVFSSLIDGNKNNLN